MIDKLLSRLDGVKQAGTGKWVARCPAHDDSSPSLAITDAGEKTLIKCWAGCPTLDVLGAIGMDFSDLFEGREQTHIKPQKYRFSANQLMFLISKSLSEVCFLLERHFAQGLTEAEMKWFRNESQTILGLCNEAVPKQEYEKHLKDFYKKNAND